MLNKKYGKNLIFLIAVIMIIAITIPVINANFELIDKNGMDKDKLNNIPISPHKDIEKPNNYPQYPIEEDIEGKSVEKDSDLIAYWSFDEGSGSIAHDSSGNGFDGTISGADWVPGYSGTGLEFSGTTDIVKYISGSLDNSISDYFSIESWIYWYGNNSGLNTYLFDARSGTGSSGRGFLFYINADHKIKFVLQTTGGQYNITGLTDIQTNEWVHIKGVYDGINNKLSLYINDILDNSTSYSLGYYDSSLSKAIGNNRWAPGDSQWRKFNGIIDELKIYGGEIEDENEPPTALFQFKPLSPTTKEVINFNDHSRDSDGRIVSWWWNFGNGYYSDLQNPVFQYYMGGTYTVSLIVTDDDGATDTLEREITVLMPFYSKS